MLDTAFTELAAVRASFCLLVARWRLTQRELKGLLAIPGPMPFARVLPDGLDAAAETRVRLLLRLDRAISAMCDGADVGALLRAPEPWSGRVPLDDLHDMDLLRATVRVAEAGGGGDRGGGGR